MSNLRSGPYTMKDKDDDAAFQALKDDVTQLLIRILRGTQTTPALTNEALPDALLVANDLSDLNNATTARSNLGLGALAVQSASSVSITGGSITGITDLAIADGGTGASTAPAALTNLGALAIANNLSDINNASTARSSLGLGNLAVQSASAVSIGGGSITGITDLAIADGGTGASTASGARTALGLLDMATQASTNVNITGGSLISIDVLDVFQSTGGTSIENGDATGGILLKAGSNQIQIFRASDTIEVSCGASSTIGTFSANGYSVAASRSVKATAASSFLQGLLKDVLGNQVVSQRGSAVTAPTGGATIDSQARTAINDIISRLQNHGLIS